MLVGFFFAFLSLIDAYFFKDPIPGYGEFGNRDAAEKRGDEINMKILSLHQPKNQPMMRWLIETRATSCE